ncbi:hypothetical protein HMPREF9440_00495 [Sutterella parvirubra YIT 11816]|uniref:Uncharacterized protein n=1 Tax=Sutterella parvirubra YIT 11816 TaxID=762967 RepID=H3KCP2_9BURK|nr:hypothetical protein HMPREF9440_00495 [Sutterella parvirubra YIT 11816]
MLEEQTERARADQSAGPPILCKRRRGKGGNRDVVSRRRRCG